MKREWVPEIGDRVELCRVLPPSSAEEWRLAGIPLGSRGTVTKLSAVATRGGSGEWRFLVRVVFPGHPHYHLCYDWEILPGSCPREEEE